VGFTEVTGAGEPHDARQEQTGSTDPHRLLDGPVRPGPTGYTPGEPVPGDVVVYFADDPRRLYQLQQWLPVLERLDQGHPVVVVTRHAQTYARVQQQTALRTVLAPAFPDLVDLYECSDHKVAIYVNNSVQNFQSLAGRRMLHLHVNHGESDKVCMVSNQVKAYDRVFVAGEAATQRHRRALIGFEDSKLVPIGRPQLDLRPAAVLPPTDRRTILYAPTWEGENSSNNYTSVDVYGPAIVAAALAVPRARVIYKPHPRVAISPDRALSAAHARILHLLREASDDDPTAGHHALPDADIFAVFPGCDLLVTDVSSVGPDFLYLHTDRPLFLTDRRNDRTALHEDTPISDCADIVDSTTISVLTSTLSARLMRDEHLAAREAMRRHYFGDLSAGESTERFLHAVDDAIATRDRLIKSHDAPAEGELRIAFT